MSATRRPADRNLQRLARALARRRAIGYQAALEEILALRERTRDDIYFSLIGRWPDTHSQTWLAWGLDEALTSISNLARTDTFTSSLARPDNHGEPQEERWVFETTAERDRFLDDRFPSRRTVGQTPGLYLTADGRTVQVSGEEVVASGPDKRYADYYTDVTAASNGQFSVRMPDGCVVTATPINREAAHAIAGEFDPDQLADWLDTEQWNAQRAPDETLRERCAGAGMDPDEARLRIVALWAGGAGHEEIRGALPQLHLYDDLIDEVLARVTAEDLDGLAA